MTPAVSIIMPCYNRAKFLERVLKAYDQQTGVPPFEIIAVDDGSADATPTLLSQYRPHNYTLRPLLLERNAGPANARNRGIELADAPLTMFVGDDILPSPSFVANHLDLHSEHAMPEFAVLGKTTWPSDLPRNTLMEHIDGVGAQQFSYYYLQDGQEYDFRHFYTSNISLKTQLLRAEPTWFDTGFRYAAYEDIELGYRLEQHHGLRIHYSVKPQAHHYHYYNIWGFAERQYRCGLMAAVFLQKYPHLRRRWGFRVVQSYQMLSRLPLLREIVDAIPADRMTEFERLTLHLASYYEYIKAPGLDGLYLLLLEHFLVSGKIDGDLEPEEALRTRKTLLLISFHFWLRDHIHILKTQQAPYPEDVVRSLLALSERLELPLVLRLKKLWRLGPMQQVRKFLQPTL